jgi:hypothetical protein
MRKPARVTQQGAGPSLPDAIQHGPTRTLPKTRRCRTPEHNHGQSGNANPGTTLTPAGAGQRDALCPYDPGPLAIALTMTMPDAWANINAAASSVEDSDPICRTCDIRATDEATSAPPLRRFILAIVIACEKNLSRGGLARLLDYAHLQWCATRTGRRVHCSIANFESAGTARAIWRWLAAFGPDKDVISCGKSQRARPQ